MIDKSHTPKEGEWLWNISLNDEEAFQQMFEHFYANLCLYAKRFIPDLRTREDIVQDVFCSVWINRKKIDYNIPVRNYLVTIVKHHCLNYLRKTNKQEFVNAVEIEKLPIYVEDNEGMFLLKELEEMFSRILAGLPTEYRIAFEMSRIENKSSNEIAEVLGVSVRSVERYRNKAVEILKTELKDYLPLLYILLNIKL